MQVKLFLTLAVTVIYCLQPFERISFKERPEERNLADSKPSSIELEIQSSDLFWSRYRIQQEEALNTTGSLKEVVVAVIDTGVDIHHERLKENIWKNPGETGKDSNGSNKEKNDIDDDKNGYVDDVYGWNFVDNNNDVTDQHGHGTHIAGIIARAPHQKKFQLGVAPNARLMVLKYFDPNSDGRSNLINTVRAIRYANQMGAEIINYSAGGPSKNSAEERAIFESFNKKILFVAAAGNESSNSDRVPYYPAGYDLGNIISVTAIDPKSEILSTSNYGGQSVDIAAPGENIYSTLPDNQFGTMTGTSQATAFASGVAALTLGSFPDLKDPEMLVRQLTKTGRMTPHFSDKVKSLSQLNAYNAITVLSNGLSHSATPISSTNRFSQTSLNQLLDSYSLENSADKHYVKRAPSAFKLRN